MGNSQGRVTTVEEVQGVFRTDIALQEAIARLTQLGFDRADLSLPGATSAPGEKAPGEGAANPNTDTDSRQLRSMGTGMAASAGAMAAAGAVVATGGLAAPVIGAAVAGGLGAGAVSQLAQRGADQVQHIERQEAAADGALVLAVHLRDASRQGAVEQAMEQAGATRIVAAARLGKDMTDSSGWTG